MGAGLIGAFVHGPHPLQLQILDVLRGDLIQRAVIGGVIIAADHEPIAGIGIAQHGVGHRREILHFTRDHKTPRRRRNGRFRPATEWFARQPARSALLSGCHRTNGRLAWPPSTADSRPRAVEIEDERRDVDISLLAQAAGIAGRHGAFEKRNQVARWCGPPQLLMKSPPANAEALFRPLRSAPWQPAQLA